MTKSSLVSESRPSSPQDDASPILSIHVPSYGTVRMRPPNPIPSDNIPEENTTLSGFLDIYMPSGSGRKRCRAIKVGVKTTCILDISPSRMGEVDEMFRREVQIGGGNDGIWLEEGHQEFGFTLILPNTLAPHDWHSNGRVNQELFGQVEGIKEATEDRPKTFKLLRLGNKGSTDGRASPFRFHLPSSHLLASRRGSASSASESVETLPPSYAEVSYELSPNDLEAEDEWLRGTFETNRTIMILYNPDPLQGVSSLNEVERLSTPALGAYEIRFSTDVFSVGGLLQTDVGIPAPGSAVTIFSIHVSLDQTYSMASPRDPPNTPRMVRTKRLPIMYEGLSNPQLYSHPDISVPALWRGRGASGFDAEGYSLTMKGRLPRDDVGRPSTLPGVITPIHVSHHLVIEIHFSVFSQTGSGETTIIPGAGGMRILRMRKAVTLPSCAFHPKFQGLPSYSQISEEPRIEDHGDNTCETCLSSTPCERHMRRLPTDSKDPEKEGWIMTPGKGWSRPKRDPLPLGTPGWYICACGVDYQLMIDRMKRSVMDERQGPTGNEDNIRAKLIAEHGE